MSTSMSAPASPRAVPYKIAVLVYIFNDAGELLLLHRKRPPNRDLYSPVGGKLEQGIGESPYACALREVEEEVEIVLTLDEIRLGGLVSGGGLGGGRGAIPPSPGVGGGGEIAPAPLDLPAAHWLMFCFEVTRAVNFPPRQIEEGRLEWFSPAALDQLSIPKTDRDVIWPLVQRHSWMLAKAAGKHVRAADIFSVHIDCTDAEHFVVTQEHPRTPASAPVKNGGN